MSRVLRNSKIHYGWFVLIGLCCFQSAGWTFTGATASIFALPVSEALGITRTDWLTFMFFYGFGFTFAAPLWGHLIQSEKTHIRVPLSIAAVCDCLGVLCFAWGANLYIYYLGGLFLGCGGVVGLNVIPNAYLCANWFAPHKSGKATSIAPTVMSIATFIIAPILQLGVDSIGYHATWFVCFIVTCVLELPWTFLVMERRPSDVGLQPIGYDEEAKDVGDQETTGMDIKAIWRTPALWCIMIATLCFAVGIGFKQNFTGISIEFLGGSPFASQATMIGAWMISVAAAAELLSNFAFGFLCDKFTVKHTITVYRLMYLVGFLVWIAAGFHPVGLLAGAFLYGTHAVFLRQGLPMVVRVVFGRKNMARISGYTLSLCGVGAAFAGSLVAMFYDVLGSYSGALILGAIIAAIDVLSLQVALHKVGRMGWEIQPADELPVDQ